MVPTLYSESYCVFMWFAPVATANRQPAGMHLTCTMTRYVMETHPAIQSVTCSNLRQTHTNYNRIQNYNDTVLNFKVAWNWIEENFLLYSNRFKTFKQFLYWLIYSFLLFRHLFKWSNTWLVQKGFSMGIMNNPDFGVKGISNIGPSYHDDLCSCAGRPNCNQQLYLFQTYSAGTSWVRTTLGNAPKLKPMNN